MPRAAHQQFCSVLEKISKYPLQSWSLAWLPVKTPIIKPLLWGLPQPSFRKGRINAREAAKHEQLGRCRQRRQRSSSRPCSGRSQVQAGYSHLREPRHPGWHGHARQSWLASSLFRTQSGSQLSPEEHKHTNLSLFPSSWPSHNP